MLCVRYYAMLSSLVSVFVKAFSFSVRNSTLDFCVVGAGCDFIVQISASTASFLSFFVCVYVCSTGWNLTRAQGPQSSKGSG